MLNFCDSAQMSITDPMIDFLVPVASDSAFLEEAVSSIRESVNSSKKRDSCRIIICNNAVISNAFEAKLDRISRIYHAECITFNERLPASENWNRSMEQCNGQYLHFLHDDDLFACEYVPSLLGMLPQYNIVLTRYTCFNDGEFGNFISGFKKQETNFSSNEDFFVFLLNSFFAASATCFLRESCKNGFNPKYRYNSDQDFIRKLAYKEGLEKVGFLDDIPYVYSRMHSLQAQKEKNLKFHSPPNLCCINSSMIKQGFADGLDPKLLGFAFSKNPSSAVRILSSYHLDWPLSKTLHLFYFFLLYAKFPFNYGTNLILRLLFQRLVWGYKLNYS
jgi:hypothetical protein